MKRNTLYTVNKANQPAFMYRENRNLFKLGGTTAGGADVLGSFINNIGNKTPDFSGLASAASGAASSGGGGIAGALGGLVGGSGGGIGGALKGAVGSMGGMSGIASAVGGAVSNLIGGGYSSGVGNVMGSLGKVASVIPGPYGAAISAGLQVLGGGVNRLFGSKVDAVRLGKANEEMNKLNSFTSNAKSLDDIKSREATASVAGIYQGGVWNKSAKKQQEELEEQMRDARQFADRSIGNNVNNLVSDMANEALANYAAYGGPLGDSFGGALGLMQQNKYIDAINNRSNAITKGLEAIAQQQPTTFTNRFDAGGFVDNFMQNPVAAAMNYIQQRDAEEAQAEAQAAQEAREQEFNNLQTRLMNAEIQNQGLQALLEDQGRSIASLQEAQALQNIAAQPQAVPTVEVGEPEPTEVLPTPSRAASNVSRAKKGTRYSDSNWAQEHMGRWRDFLLKKGVNSSDASRLSEFFTAQDGLESAEGKSNAARTKNNYGGMQRGGKNISYNSINDYMEDKWKMMNNKFRPALAAKTVDEYATILGNPNTAGKGYLYYVTDKVKYNPKSEEWKAAQTQHMNNYINGMRAWSKKAFGGELGTNGTDFTNGLLQVNAGNTHERNPFGGVPMGLDQQGIPNLVEEGETVFNDYVFSKRLKVPNFMLKDLGLPEIKSHGKRHRLSFADVSKKLAEESEKRPNDPISMNGLKASLSKLTEIQEAERMKERAKLQNREMAMMSDMGLVAACGGKLGKKYSGEENHSSKMDRQWKLTDDNNDYYFFGNTYKPSLTSGHIPFERNRDTAQEESSPRFRAWTNYVLDNWDNDDVKNYLQALNTRAGGYMDFNDREAARNYFRRARGLDVKEGPNSGKGDHNWGFYHDTPTWLGNEADLNRAASPYRFTPYVGLDSAPEGEMGRLAQAAEDARRADENASLRAAADAEAGMARLPEANRASGNNNTYKPYDTWMRYAPAVGAGIFTLTDALGLTNRPDYTYAGKLEAAANRAAYAPNIEAPAIGDYMRYTPFDRLFYANQMQANARATDRALMNTSGGNRGTAQAAMLANGYNTNNNLGNLYRQAEEYNRGQYERTKEFNRRTNMFNAQMGLEADMANARYRQQAAQMGLSGLAQAANMREAIDARTGAARSANITNLLNSLGNIGRENFALNQINSDRSNRYGERANGTTYYKGTGKAKGGKIQRRKK